MRGIGRIARQHVEDDGPELLRIDGEIWTRQMQGRLYIRARVSPVELLQTLPAPDPTPLRFVITAKNEAPKVQEVVRRTPQGPTLCDVPVESRVLEVIERSYEGVRLQWGVWRGFFVARDPSAVLVAIWKVPDGYAAMEVFPIELDGSFWAVNDHLAFRLPAPPADKCADLRRRAAKHAPTVAILQKILDAPPGRVVEVVADRLRCHVGPVEIPIDQYHAIATYYRDGLVWHWTGPYEVVVARSGGIVVGVVHPIAVESRGGEG